MSLRAAFPEYVTPTKEEFEELWKEAIIVPDTNVLLDLYRYSSDTREELIGIFEKLQERIWIPHRVAFEFMRRRREVIAEQLQMRNGTKVALDRVVDDADKEIHNV